MIEFQVSDIASFVAESRKVLQGFGRSQYWYRGHASAVWKLVPSVHREYDRTGEHNLSARFRLSAPTRYEKVPGLNDMAGWLTLMQHFGLPTRLLDWSMSPLTALYFAVAHESQSGPANVWMLVPDGLNLASQHKGGVTYVLTGPEAKPLLSAALEGGAPVEDVLAVLGHDIDLRMTIQQSAFTIHGTGVPLEDRPGADKYLVKVIIPENAKARIAEELWFLGVRRSNLFPDLGNLAADLASDVRIIPRKTVSPESNK